MKITDIRTGHIVGLRGRDEKFVVAEIQGDKIRLKGATEITALVGELKRMKIQPEYLKELGFDVYRGKYVYKTIELIKIGNIYNLRNMGDSITGIDYMDEVQDFVKLLTGDSL